MGLPHEPPAPGVPRRGTFWGYALVALQLALILLIVRTYEVGSRLHFFPVLCVAAGGFLVHAALPPRFRLAFFCFLSLATVVFVLGAPDGALVIGIGAGLIGAGYLPVPFRVRAGLVLGAGLVLAVLRLDLTSPFWPVLGSMFMFRLIVFLHELQRAPARPPLGLTVAYFFPLPNVCFLFFPIFGFKTFRDTYRPGAGWADAQVGIGFLTTGLVHLLAYRLVKYYVLPSPHQLGDAAHLALFLAANYALYLHVSGYFHIITGVFHLFGFGVPRTHHNYFLAASPTDIWRRINIPWKEFMAAVFFFPAFYATRRAGTRAALAAAALWVFAMTWFLHSYQVFWITGGFTLDAFDAGLWLAAGALVAGNLMYDYARARRPRTAPDGSAGGAVRRAAAVVGTFVLVSVFWTCWNTPELLALVRVQATDPRWLAGGGRVAAVLAGAVAAGAAIQLALARPARSREPGRPSPARAAGVRVALLVVAAAAGRHEVAAQFGPEVARRVGEIRRESVTPIEAARAVRGYYEDIADAPVRAGAWLAALEGRPAPPRRTAYADLCQPADALIGHELIPGWAGDVEGYRLTINRYGMRDRSDRTREKPPGARRVALVGSSVVMGWGVGDEETFARLVEDRLNAGGAAPRYELLNFGTGKSSAIQRLAVVERRAFGFAPDAVFYFAHQDEFIEPPRHLVRLLASGYDLPPYLRDVARTAGLTPAMPPGEAEARLVPHATRIVSGVYRDLASVCRRRGVVPVWVYLPMPGVDEPPNLAREMSQLAQGAGFVVLDLSGWEGGRRSAEVKIGDVDPHANALGHRLIADRLEAAVRERPEVLGPP
ncbi:hypothetical protein FTUN_3075 [Frigoriglobus tundricola]|uniref:SGNH hydrolase-type esterase domain-containing protein n=2 Tax=Frigoriglobus tundricola TaxID=2774151 RepID=A0A6M5YQ86_9BACT|nr:hypothetical protein FTUN_3075 [Frigoriglobus tundricola]